MTVNMTKQVRAGLDGIKSIPEDRREHVLRRLGLSLLETFCLSAEGVEMLLLIINRERCVPPLPEDDIGRIARSVAEEEARNVGRMVSAVICLDNIPADESEAVMEIIDTLPCDGVCFFSEADTKSPHMQAILEKLQGSIIDFEIDSICNDTVSVPGIDESVATISEPGGVTAVKFMGYSGTRVFPLPIEEVLAGLFPTRDSTAAQRR